MFTKHANVAAIASSIASLDGTIAALTVSLSVLKDGECKVGCSASTYNTGTLPGVRVFSPIADWLTSNLGGRPPEKMFVYDIDVEHAEHADHVSGHFGLTAIVVTISVYEEPQSAYLIAIADDAESALQWKLAFDGTTNIPLRPSHWPVIQSA